MGSTLHTSHKTRHLTCFENGIKGVFGNVLINDDFLKTMDYPSTNLQGTISSLYTIGAFVGSLSTIWTGDIFGRPRQIFLGAVILAIGATIQASSFSVAQMIVGRIVAGVGTGMNTATASIWQAETSTLTKRGQLIIIQMVCLSLAVAHSIRTRLTHHT